VTARILSFRLFLMLSSVVLTAAVGVGCSGTKVETKSSSELSRYRIQSLAVIPFTAIETPQARDQTDFVLPVPASVRRSDISLGIPSYAEARPKQTVGVPAYAAGQVTEQFWKRLQDRKGIQVLSQGDVARILSSEKELGQTTTGKTLTLLAQRLNVDAVVTGLVTTYQERVGSRLGADPTAAVGFEVKVVAADGQVLWVGDYYERQRPMNEDLMGFLQRWSFVTAEELAEYGVEEVLKEFPFGVGEEH